jgi:hypothetical protein
MANGATIWTDGKTFKPEKKKEQAKPKAKAKKQQDEDEDGLPW